jgi:hypothetical protein
MTLAAGQLVANVVSGGFVNCNVTSPEGNHHIAIAPHASMDGTQLALSAKKGSARKSLAISLVQPFWVYDPA